MRHLRLIVLAACGLLAITNGLAAQYVPAKLKLRQLPVEHEYQQALRAYLGSLTEAELAVELKPLDAAAAPLDEEGPFRHWLLALHVPNVQAATLPAAGFTLRALEAEEGIALPAEPNASQTLAWLAHWDFSGNPYRGLAALKRRAFVLAAVDAMLLDYLYEHAPGTSARSDFLGGNLIWLGYTWGRVRDVAPPAAREAMDAVLKKHVRRLAEWGPRGAMTDMDLFAPVGLHYVSEAVRDPEISRIGVAYARRLFTEERFFHPAGYFVDVGCFDTSYNGISLYFASWAALATQWNFAREAVDKGYRLRGLLSFPSPDGSVHGPSHMSSRTSADPPHDQWNFPHRPYAAAQVTDDALHLAPLPTAAELANATKRVVAALNQQLAAPRPAQPRVWQESHWSGAINFAHEHYQPGHYARRKTLAAADSPLQKMPWARAETFQRNLANGFVIARFDSYAAAVHTGPIRGWPNGLGGGQLSAFWTPAAGPLWLGRRRGMQGSVADSREEWRSWPIHAVSGLTAAGQLFTSADLAQPLVKSDVKSGDTSQTDPTTTIVQGPLKIGDEAAALAYERRFHLRPDGVTIATSLQAAAPTPLRELYETLPVFLHEQSQISKAGVQIQFQVDGKWLAASAQPVPQVRAIQVERFDGALRISLDRPRTVRISPQDWIDGYQTRAACRTILVDWRSPVDAAQPFTAGRIEYTLAPAAKFASP